jgi:FAD/FMN-containing dehydrogenase
LFSRRDFLKLATLAWPASAWSRVDKKAKPPPGILVNDIHSQLNSARVWRIVAPDTLDGLRSALRTAQREEKAICISGSRHAMGGQQFLTDGLMIDTRRMNRVLGFDAERGHIEVEAGIQWPQLLQHLVTLQKGRERQWAFAQKQTGADKLTMGGCLAANVHGRGLKMPPFIGDVESFRLLTAKGEVVQCSRSENQELFRLAIGGYGLFGLITSVTLRLVERRKLERVVEVRSIEGLDKAFAERMRDGFLYGDFQYAIDETSDDFLRRGVFCCYRPVDPATPIPPGQKELRERDWIELLHLAHAAKGEAFRRYAGFYLSTNGQVYWSDEQQMSVYPENYHRALDQRVGAQVRATEAITEIYCERDALERFMTDVRDYARRDKVDLIYGTVRLIEQDRESFLAWARRPYACVIFNVHVEHTTSGLIKAGDVFRRLIDIGLKYGGSYFPTYNRYALRRQVDACYPQLQEFLKLKLKHDPQELFQSEWYRHYKRMYEKK